MCSKGDDKVCDSLIYSVLRYKTLHKYQLRII